MILHSTITPDELAEVHVILREVFADAVLKFSQKHNVSLGKIDVLGSHVQTTWLLPMPEKG